MKFLKEIQIFRLIVYTLMLYLFKYLDAKIDGNNTLEKKIKEVGLTIL